MVAPLCAAMLRCCDSAWSQNRARSGSEFSRLLFRPGRRRCAFTRAQIHRPLTTTVMNVTQARGLLANAELLLLSPHLQRAASLPDSPRSTISLHYGAPPPSSIAHHPLKAETRLPSANDDPHRRACACALAHPASPFALGAFSTKTHQCANPIIPPPPRQV